MEKFFQLLGEDLTKQVKAKIGDVKFFIGEGEFIPKGRFDDINTQLKDAKAQVADRDKQIESLRESAKGNEALTARIKELQDANTKAAADYATKLAAKERDYLIDTALINSRPKNFKALKALLDNEKITIKDGKLEGLDEQIKALQKSDSYLFDVGTPVPSKSGLEIGRISQLGGNPQPGGNAGITHAWNAHKGNVKI